MEYKDGVLWADGFRIDMIYKRVLYSELFATMGIDNPITRAMRDGNVFITNSISAKMLAKKASLAFLSDTENEHFFSADQRRRYPYTYSMDTSRQRRENHLRG